MQDLTHEEAIIAFNNREHNNKPHMCARTVTPKVNNHLATRADSHDLANTLLPCIKLEADSGHVLETEAGWQSTTVNDHLRLDLNTTKLLLQGSDDPLISHGASNDAHDEDQDYPFKTLLARKSEQQAVHNGACSTLTKQQLKANLMNARKLHKPIVQEVTTPIQKLTRQVKPKKRSTAANGAIKLRFHHQALPAEYAAHYEATQGRHATTARTTPPVPAVKATAPNHNQSHENVRSWLRKIAEIQRSAERQQQAQESLKEPKPRPQSLEHQTQLVDPTPDLSAGSKRGAMKYADLPYMGEITLDNYKPRRGRKPKKADICHLIYKNYGTIIPPAVVSDERFTVKELKSSPASQPASFDRVGLSKSAAVILSDEPLNLCVRDQSSDRYSISSGDSDKPSTVTNATTSPNTEYGSSSHRTTPLTEDHMSIKPTSLDFGGDEKPRIAAKLLLQPVGLYYQQLMENCRLGVPVETIEKDNQLALKIPLPSGFFATTTAIAAKREPLEQQPTESTAQPAMSKRKRSAIFIPPMPAENSSSPSTEVSICKFKFTGGAKPTLQEKKMLSVDAEGNYRYYSGTGERTMRGYEFISREQQQPLQQLTSSNCSNDKLYIDIPPPSTDLSLELLHIPSVSPTSSLLMSSSLVPVPPQSPSNYSNSQSPLRQATPYPEDCHKRMDATELVQNTLSNVQAAPATVSGKRRSTRRSKQREKLEKTFKEKGFLIQTQQLQSAEGATYCKFRQLKKFTRYLFRNWKDHIPERDLGKHQGKDSDSRGHIAIESMLAGQIALGVENVAASQQAT